MAAFKYTLTQTPTQILNGTKAAYVQEIRGKNTRFTASATAPNTSTAPYCQILKNDLSVATGFPLWAWTPTSDPIEIVVLEEV